MNIRRPLRAMMLAAALVAVPAAAEQIILYERSNFTGRHLTIERDLANLDDFGFGNRASSAYVMSGTWELCTGRRYQGSCQTVTPGGYRTLGNQSNRVSSIRPVHDWGGGGWDGWRGGEVELYDGQNFQGRLGVLHSATPDFERLGVNDRVASLIVRRGTWQFCTDADYGNNCRVYGPGQYPQIWGGQDDRYSSARPVGAGGHPASARESWPDGQARIRIFEYPGFAGRSILLRHSVDSFEQIDFNDRAESILVEGGEWRLCSDANRQGDCRILRPGQYPVLPPALRNTLSSAYRRW